MYNYTNNQHLNLADEYSISLRNHRVTKGRKSVFAAGCLRYKNKRLLWYQNRWQSLSLLVFGKLAVAVAMPPQQPYAVCTPGLANRPRCRVTQWICGIRVFLYLHARLLNWTTLTKARKDSLLNSVSLNLLIYFYSSVTWVRIFRASQLVLVAFNLTVMAANILCGVQTCRFGKKQNKQNAS